MLEAVTAALGTEVEMANKYEIYGQNRGAELSETHLFYAVEETDFCTRQVKSCCPDCAPWNVSIFYTEGGQQQLALKLERPCTFTCCCFNRPTVEVKNVVSGQVMGSLVDPFACCNLTFSVQDPQQNLLLKANGGCCQWGLCCPLPCGPCAEVHFDIEKPDGGDSIGHIKKKVPGCCKWLIASDVENYKVDFGSVKEPRLKAMLMALTIFIDFRYFNDNKNDDGPSIPSMAVG